MLSPEFCYYLGRLCGSARTIGTHALDGDQITEEECVELLDVEEAVRVEFQKHLSSNAGMPVIHHNGARPE